MPPRRIGYRLAAGFLLSVMSLILGLRGGNWFPVLRDLPLAHLITLAIIWPTMEFLFLAILMGAVLGLWVFGGWPLVFLCGMLVLMHAVARYTRIRSSILVGLFLPVGIVAWYGMTYANLFKYDPWFVFGSALMALAWGVLMLIVSGELGLNRVKVRR